MTTTYIVTFEINDLTRRNAFIEKMREYAATCPIHGNCWAIQSEETPAQVRDKLWEPLASDDRLFVIRSGTHAAWTNTYGDDNSNWLKEKL